MPHKRNPVTAENIVGIARLLRGYLQPTLESVALWQHRDISHSSVERIVLPDAAALAEHILSTTAGEVDGLQIDPEAIAANIDRAGLRLLSQRLLDGQLDAGTPRRDAMAAVRSQLASNTVASHELPSAANDVLASDHLARTFAAVDALRRRHTDPSTA